MRPRSLLATAAFFLALSALSRAADAPAPAGEDALRAQRLAWFNKAKFGMFIHWGAYSVPARAKPGQLAEWVMHNERIPIPDYEKFTDQFKAENYDPEAWVKLAQRAGMRYVTLTSKHHDGFCLFDSKLSDYTAMKRGPKRDLLGDLAKACQRHGMPICFYYSLLDWHHPDYPKNMPRFAEYLQGQIRELCTNYGKIDGIWFDGEWEKPAEQWRSAELVALIRKLQPLAVINDRLGAGTRSRSKDADFFTHEQTIPTGTVRVARAFHPWETCQTFGHSWGYLKDEKGLKSPKVVIQQLIDVSSKGGNFLLNVGPRADGTIAPEHVERLEAIGEWMKVNGEAIYDSTYSPFGQPPFGRYTRVGNAVYLHLFTRPGDTVAVPTRADNVTSVTVLGGGKLDFRADGDRTALSLPEKLDPIATVVRIELKELKVTEAEGGPIRQAADGSLTLPASAAELHGETIRVEERRGEGNLGWWSKASDWASWSVEVRQGGKFDVELLYACAPSGGGRYALAVGDQKLEADVAPTKGWTDFATARPGTLDLPAGKHTLTLKAVRITGEGLLNVARITLKPAK